MNSLYPTRTREFTEESVAEFADTSEYPARDSDVDVDRYIINEILEHWINRVFCHHELRSLSHVFLIIYC